MKVLRILAIILLAAMMITPEVISEKVEREAVIVDLDGDVILHPKGGEKEEAYVGAVMKEGDILETKDGGWALLKLEGIETAIVEVYENSQLLLSEFVMDEEKNMQKTLLDLGAGKVLVKAKRMSGQDSKFQVKTPTSVVGVEGGESASRFEVVVETLADVSGAPGKEKR